MVSKKNHYGLFLVPINIYKPTIPTSSTGAPHCFPGRPRAPARIHGMAPRRPEAAVRPRGPQEAASGGGLVAMGELDQNSL